MRFLASYRDAVAARWGTLPGNLRGILWMLMGTLAFSGMQVTIKQVGQSLSVWQILEMRSALALVFVIPAVARIGFSSLGTARPGAHALRAFLGCGGIATLVLSLQHLDLAIVATLGFANTLFVIVLAWAFLGEKIVRDRTVATLVGFVGVLICLRPGPEGVDVWALVMLASAVFAAGVHTMIKSLTRTERPTTILFYAYVGILILAAIPCALTWKTPTLEELALVAGIALCTTLGQTSMVLALRAGDAVAVAPVGYVRILWATLFGFLIFSEVPAWSTFAGAAVIVGATLYLAVRERRQGAKAARGLPVDGRPS